MRLRLPLHGRSHLPQGSDPIPGFGLFLHWGVNTDSTNIGLVLDANDNVRITENSASGITIECPGGPVVLRGDQVQIVDAGGAGADVSVEGPYTVASTDSGITMQADDAFNINIPTAGQVFTVSDASNNPIFSLTG